jgi:hypothetical protein
MYAPARHRKSSWIIPLALDVTNTETLTGVARAERAFRSTSLDSRKTGGSSPYRRHGRQAEHLPARGGESSQPSLFLTDGYDDVRKMTQLALLKNTEKAQERAKRHPMLRAPHRRRPGDAERAVADHRHRELDRQLDERLQRDH